MRPIKDGLQEIEEWHRKAKDRPVCTIFPHWDSNDIDHEDCGPPWHLLIFDTEEEEDDIVIGNRTKDTDCCIEIDCRTDVFAIINNMLLITEVGQKCYLCLLVPDGTAFDLEHAYALIGMGVQAFDAIKMAIEK